MLAELTLSNDTMIAWRRSKVLKIQLLILKKGELTLKLVQKTVEHCKLLFLVVFFTNVDR